jgi:predicted phosphate transport protein (TIGR00153 family)
MHFMPREERFFELFIELAEVIKLGSRALLDMLDKMDDLEGRATTIRDLEHRGDNITHEIKTKLNKTFITPFDREDIHALSSHMDDVLDYIEVASNKIVLYKITARSQPAVEIGQILVRCADRMCSAVGNLEKGDHISDDCIELNRLENDADRVSRSAIAELFETERDPIALIKLKELLEDLESATDRCEDVANTLETVVIKNA